MMKSAIRLITLFAILVAIYLYRDQIAVFAKGVVSRFSPAPCTQPIAYSLGTFDTDFGISKTQFLADIKKAESIWEKPAGKQLFAYSDTGSLKVNLIYDYRQSATDKMQAIGGTIDSTKAQYDMLKVRLDANKAEYAAQKNAVESEFAQYESDKKAYEDKVAYWNAKGGAPKSQFNELENERQALNAEATKANDDNHALNALVTTMNDLVAQINPLAKKLNLNVETYNQVSASTGGEFEEGVYEEDANGKRISIFQFTDNDKLVRVLAHELGHALGLEHVDDPKAIMYYLNVGENDSPTSADVSELKALCKLQ